MEDISMIAKGGIGAAVAVLAAIAWMLVREILRRREEREKKRDEVVEELKDASAKWSAALFCGDMAAAEREKKRMDRLLKLRESLGAIALVALGLCLAGCATQTKVVVLTEHCRVMHPGEVLPDLPKDEPHWCVLTPTGMKTLLPEDLR